jgi:uncharacterized protein (DUF2141 family)
MTTRRMKTAALLLSITAAHAAAFTLLPVGSASAQEAAGAATVTITFQGITRQSGEIRGQMFCSEADYSGKAGKAAGAFAVPVTAASVSTTIAGVTPGQCAVRAFHDVDGDGKMGTNPFGIPTEPFAFSNDAKGAFGPASWADAAFAVGAGETAHSITID